MEFAFKRYMPLVKRERGFTLIEALIALFVFSVALLGIAALLARAVGVSHSAYLRSVASIQAMDMAERIRANVGSDAGSGDYVLNCTTLPVTPPDCISAACTSADLVKWDHSQWCAANSARFKGLFTSAAIVQDGNDYVISIVWKERQLAEGNAQSISDTTDADGNALFTWRVRQ